MQIILILYQTEDFPAGVAACGACLAAVACNLPIDTKREELLTIWFMGFATSLINAIVLRGQPCSSGETAAFNRKQQHHIFFQAIEARCDKWNNPLCAVSSLNEAHSWVKLHVRGEAKAFPGAQEDRSDNTE